MGIVLVGAVVSTVRWTGYVDPDGRDRWIIRGVSDRPQCETGNTMGVIHAVHRQAPSFGHSERPWSAGPCGGRDDYSAAHLSDAVQPLAGVPVWSGSS